VCVGRVMIVWIVARKRVGGLDTVWRIFDGNSRRPLITCCSGRSEWSVFKLSVVFSHLPEQHVIGDLRLFPSNMQSTATECIFRYLLIIRTLVIIE
jgi:hypothetical protein